jgi:hypothetical protein
MSPDRDASFLAHEFGHFLSDADGSTKLGPYIALGKGEPLSPEQKAAILDEERLAWRLGRGELARLGCDDWDAFGQLAAENVRTYETGLATYRRA